MKNLENRIQKVFIDKTIREKKIKKSSIKNKAMLETEFKALMHCGIFVDANLLGKGIYACEKPFIYFKDETIESMIERGKQMKDMTGALFLNEKYFEDLKQCELVPISIKIESEKIINLH